MTDEKSALVGDLDSEESRMPHVMREFDWKATSLGPIESWPATLHTSVSICIHSQFPALILWGEEYIQIYNDAYRKLIGKKHPADFGSRAKESWQKKNWNELAPLLASVIKNGKPLLLENHKFTTVGNGTPEERYYTTSYSPIYGGTEKPLGIFVTVLDKTDEAVSRHQVRNSRHQQLADLFLHGPVAMCILSGPDRIVDLANAKMLDVLDKTSDQVLGRPIFEGVPDANVENYKRILARVDSGERIILEEIPFILPENAGKKSRVLKIMHEPLRDADGGVSGIMVLADDLSSQVRMQKEIREHEDRLHLAIEASRLGTFEWNISSSVFHCSQRLAEIFGFTDCAGLDHEKLGARIHPEDQKIQLAAHQKASDTGELHYEARVVWPDQSIHWIMVNGKLTREETENRVSLYGTVADITEERSRTEVLEQLVAERTSTLQRQNEELKNSEERYHKMVDQVEDYAIILLDKDGLIRNWNKGAEKIKRYKEQEILGKHFSIFYRPEDQQINFPQRLLKHAADHGKASDEGWRVRKDSTMFWGSVTLTALHDDDNNIIGFSKVTRDLTDRKKSEDRLREYADELRVRNIELRQSEERYHKMISEVQDYAIVLMDPEGLIQNWNAGAQNIKGYKADEIIGKSFKTFYTQKDRGEKLPDRLLAIARKEGRAIHEGWRVRKDGTRFWGSIVITALHNNAHEVIGFSKVTRDLTERKLSEDKLNAYTAELEIQNRELEQFAYIASHDLQEPLRKIQTFSELLQRSIKADSDTAKYFDKINTSAQRMSDLIKSVLNYSKLSRDEEKFTDVNLESIVENIKADFELLINEKKAIIHCEKLPTLKGILLQLNQLFANLISNSLKFSDKRPVIAITSRVVAEQEVIGKPENFAAGNYYEIAVADNGIGFEQQYAEQIFNMFQRLHGKQKYAGTGIGLALCRKIVDIHKGHIVAKSEPGMGATFYVYLPLETRSETGPEPVKDILLAKV